MTYEAEQPERGVKRLADRARREQAEPPRMDEEAETPGRTGREERPARVESAGRAEREVRAPRIASAGRTPQKDRQAAAGRQEPAERAAGPVRDETPARREQPAPTNDGTLLPAGERDQLTLRLQQAVNGFVDSPRQAVEQADRIFEEAVSQVTDTLTERGGTLRTTWNGADQGSATEELRLALRSYREVTERLLKL